MKGQIEFEWYKGRWQFIVIVSYLPRTKFEAGLRADGDGGALNFFVAGFGIHVSVFRYPAFTNV